MGLQEGLTGVNSTGHHSVVTSQTWRLRAKCYGRDFAEMDALFFPGSGGKPGKARKFCGGCPVQGECLEEAIEIGAEGFWSGTTEDERKEMAKLRKLAIDKLSADQYVVSTGTVPEELITVTPVDRDWMDEDGPSILDMHMLERYGVE